MQKVKAVINIGHKDNDPMPAFIKDSAWRSMGFTIYQTKYTANGDIHMTLFDDAEDAQAKAELLKGMYNVLSIKIENNAEPTKA